GDAFTISEGEVTDPEQSPFGFHLFKVTSIEPEEVTPFEDVRDEIKKELALLEAEDRLPSFATQLDDELAAGSNVRDAAGAIGLNAETVAMVDRQGRDENGEPVTALEGWSPLLQTAFDAAKAEPSLLEETDEGAYYVIEVDEIAEPRLKTPDEVRDDVVALFEEQKRREGAKAKAEDILLKAKETASLQSLAASDDLTIETIDLIRRSDDGTAGNINRAAIDALFRTDAGAVADQVVEMEDGVLVIATDEIVEKTGSEDQAAIDQLKTELERQVQADLLDQYGRALQNVHAITINEDALQRLIDYDPAAHAYGGGGMAPGGPSPAMF
ncbi:MAG: peptidylprolyl isomerase, partial [Geminicoccaceae bacterium]